MEIGFVTSVVETVQKPATYFGKQFTWPWRRQTHTPDDRYDNIIVEKLSDYPHGYPRLAAYLNSDVNTRLYRRFGYLHSRLLLHRQDELSALERDLAALDARDERDDPYRLNSRRYDDDNNNDDDDEQPSEGQSQKRKHLNEIHYKLKEYDELLIRERDLMAMEKPQLGNYRHLYNWIWETKPLCEEETSFMYHRDDFVILASAEEYGWLGSFMDVLLAVIPRRVMLFLFSSPAAPLEETSEKKKFAQYSNDRLNVLYRTFIAIISTLLLMTPIVVLYVPRTSKTVQICLLVVFVLSFSLVLSIATNARRQEIFGATAAYAAVLVVFLGSLPS